MADTVRNIIFNTYTTFLRGKGYSNDQITGFAFQDEQIALGIINQINNNDITLDEGIKLAIVLAEGRVAEQIEKGEELPLNTVVYHEPRRRQTKKQEMEQAIVGEGDRTWTSTILEVFSRKDVLFVGNKLEIDIKRMTEEQMHRMIEGMGRYGILPKSSEMEEKDWETTEWILRNNGYVLKGGQK